MNQTAKSGEHRKSELAEIRRELREKQSYLSDGSEDLWAAISQWLLESYNTPVGSLRTKVRGALAALQDDHEHKMYDHPEVDEGSEAFPDRCKGCPHYGVQCPVLARHVSKQTLERIFDEAEDDDELQGRLSRYAAKHHCQVIQAEIGEWETGYSEFLSRGERLRLELNADINGIDLDDVGVDIEAALAGDADADGDGAGGGVGTAASGAQVPAAVADGAGSAVGLQDDVGGEGPPEEVAERVGAIEQSLMSEDDEEAES